VTVKDFWFGSLVSADPYSVLLQRLKLIAHCE